MERFPFTIRSESEELTSHVGEMIARRAFTGLAILLEGDLGAGKTVLVRGCCLALGCSNIRSPSFTLVNVYECDGRTVVHSDLYRLSFVDPSELDMDHYMDVADVIFIEWADRGTPWDFSQLWRISFAFTGEDDERELTFSAEGEMAKRALEQLFLDMKRELYL